LDADALNRLAANRDLWEKLAARKGVSVLTPHSGEMMRLLGKDVFAEMGREEQAKSLASQTGAYVVLKGPHSLVADPSGGIYYNLSGCTALATAGSGDVLSGIIAALLARPAVDIPDAVRAGVLIHGLTGEYAAPLPSSGRGVTADDLLEQIVPVMRDISPFA
jgi:NAD(P)H-hydrate epimerase